MLEAIGSSERVGSPEGGPAPLPLTERQLEIIGLVARGYTNRRIGDTLGITPATVKRHLERIYDRAGVRTRAGVTAMVLRGGPPGPSPAAPAAPAPVEPTLAQGPPPSTLHQ